MIGEHLSFSQGAIVLIGIFLVSVAGYWIAGLPRRIRLKKINKVLARRSWGAVIPYSRINEHKSGAFMVRK